MERESRTWCAVWSGAQHARLHHRCAGDADFDVNKACLKEDPELLARAKAAYDVAYKARTRAPSPSHKGSSADAGLHIAFP